MFDHIKAAAMTVAGIVRGLLLTGSPHAWRYRYRDALYEVRHGHEWCDYELAEDDFEPHGARTSDEVLEPGTTGSLDDIKKQIDDAIAGLNLDDLPVSTAMAAATAAVKEHESHFMFRPRSTKSRAQIYSDGPDGEQFNAMQD